MFYYYFSFFHFSTFACVSIQCRHGIYIRFLRLFFTLFHSLFRRRLLSGPNCYIYLFFLFSNWIAFVVLFPSSLRCRLLLFEPTRRVRVEFTIFPSMEWTGQHVIIRFSKYCWSPRRLFSYFGFVSRAYRFIISFSDAHNSTKVKKNKITQTKKNHVKISLKRNAFDSFGFGNYFLFSKLNTQKISQC